MATVNQIRRQALPAGTQLIAGEPGIYNEVNWVSTLKPYPPGLDAAKGNEFILIDMAVATRLGASLPSLVLLLAQHGASGIGLLGEPTPEALKEAQTREMPILLLPPGSNLLELQERITSLASEERYHLYQKEQELSQKVMEVALAGRGITAILQRLEEVTGRKVWLLGPDYQFLFPPDPELAGIPNEERERLSKLVATLPSRITGFKLAESACFVGHVQGSYGVEGYLLLLAPPDQLGEDDRLAVKVGSLALAIEMSRRQAVETTEERFQSEMMEALLSGNLSPSAVGERTKKLGLDLSSLHVAAAAQVTTSPFRPDQRAKKAESLFGDLCHWRGDSLIVLHQVAPPVAAHELRRWGQEAARLLTTRLEGTASLGIGRSYSGLEGLRLSLREAEEALSVGIRLFGPGSVSFFGDLGVYRLLLTAQKDELQMFYQEYLGPLADYDEKHGGDLLATLEALLQHPTLAEAAKVLHVHRNTLLYRLQRIQDITGLKLEEGESRLILHLALHAKEVIRGS